MDKAIRLIVLAAGGVSVLVIGVAMLWSGVRATGFGPPPVITPPPGPLRTAPANPGGLTVPEADEPIMSGQTTAGTPQLAPAAPAMDISVLNGGSPAAAPPPALAAAAPAAPANAPAGDVAVQLAAAGSADGAMAVWAGLQAKFPDLLKGRTPQVIPVIVNGQSLWRLRVRGFADQSAAQAFCAQLAAEQAPCTLAAF